MPTYLSRSLVGEIAHDATQGIQRDFDSQLEADLWADEQAAALRRECAQDDLEEQEPRWWLR